MSLFQAIILAAVQGLGEFLPISSSAHLILIPWLLGWPDPGQPFDVALHAGTLIAVIVYFFKDWVELIAAGLGLHYPSSASAALVSQNRRIFWYLVAATIPGGLVGWLFEHKIEENLRNPRYIAIAMIAIAILMWIAERIGRLAREIEQLHFGDAMAIGTAQALALFPGVSRSGITISQGLFQGLTREAAAKFSFLLSTPLIAGAAAHDLPGLIKMHKAAGGLDLPLSTLVISVAVSAIVGYIVIAFFLKYLRTHTLKIFIYYRIVFGIVILVLTFLPFGSAR
jgi:undecaprenyl-diphosphatase